MYRFTTIFSAATVVSLFATTTVLAQTNTPSLKIETPQEGQTIYGSKVPVLISTENFQIVSSEEGKANQPGEGFVYLWLDTTDTISATATKVTEDIYTFSDVAYGEHTLTAELVNNNSTSLTPKVTTTVKFKNEPATSPSPSSAANLDKNTAAVILVIVALVILAAWWYTKDDEDEMPKEETIKPAKTTTRRKKTTRKSTRARRS